MINYNCNMKTLLPILLLLVSCKDSDNPPQPSQMSYAENLTAVGLQANTWYYLHDTANALKFTADSNVVQVSPKISSAGKDTITWHTTLTPQSKSISNNSLKLTWTSYTGTYGAGTYTVNPSNAIIVQQTASGPMWVNTNNGQQFLIFK